MAIPTQKVTHYYLMKDGLTLSRVRPEDPNSFKAVINAKDKREAMKVLNRTFTKNPDGSWGERIPGKDSSSRRVRLTTPKGDKSVPLPTVPPVPPGPVDPEEESVFNNSGIREMDLPDYLRPRKPTATFHALGVKFTVPQGSWVTVTSEHEVIVDLQTPLEPLEHVEDPIGLALSGKVD